MEDQKDTQSKNSQPRKSHSRKGTKQSKSQNQMVRTVHGTKQTMMDKAHNAKSMMADRAHHAKQTVAQQTKGMRKDMSGTIAKGAAGVAVTAGVIAAGAALSKRENRDKLSEGARKTFYVLQDMVGTMLEENPELYEQMTPPMGMKGGASKRKKTSKSKSTTKSK